MLGWITRFFLIILLYHDFASGFLRQEDGYSHLRNYLTSKLSWPNLNLVKTRWIEQPVDHFNSLDNRSWKMQYFENLEFFKFGGPIYLFIGGEGAMVPDYLKGGFIYELAEETSGAMFASEHRYYGQSKPEDVTKLADLKYLSSRQAIADIVQLLLVLKQDEKFQSSKVVVIGGSYAGMLATWTRLLYPTVIDAAVASSAPVQAKFEFNEYVETVGDAYKKYGSPGCYDHIAVLVKNFTYIFGTPERIHRFQREMHFCETSDLIRKENQNLFFDDLLNLYNTQRIRNVNYIKYNCQYLTPQRLLNRISCKSLDFDNYIQDLKSPLDIWLYQTCTEFGFKMTRSDLVEECNLVYGPYFTTESIKEAVSRTNDFYGGLKPNVTKVVFTNGEIDPWHKLSVLEDLNPEAPARVIPQMSHCTDLNGEHYNASKEFVETVRFVKKTIKQWIGL